MRLPNGEKRKRTLKKVIKLRKTKKISSKNLQYLGEEEKSPKFARLNDTQPPWWEENSHGKKPFNDAAGTTKKKKKISPGTVSRGHPRKRGRTETRPTLLIKKPGRGHQEDVDHRMKKGKKVLEKQLTENTLPPSD